MRTIPRAVLLIVLGVWGGAAGGSDAIRYPARVSVVLPVSSSEFPAGDGAAIANAQCLMCHSSGMVLRQPPQTPAQWSAIINKMRKVYGAPMPEEQVPALSSYLASLPAGALLLEEGPTRRSAAAVTGELIFQARCAPCHQATGTGIPGAFPPLAGSPWVTGSKSVLVEIALKGIQGPLTVKNSTYAGLMPAFAPQLDDREIAAVLSYVRSQWGNGADPVDSLLVKSLRATVPAPSSPWNGEADLKSREEREP